MSGDSRSFPLTAHKAERLRQAGVFPYSRDVMTFAVLLGAGIGTGLVMSAALERLPGLTRLTWQTPMPPRGGMAQLGEHAQRWFETALLLAAAFLTPLIGAVLIAIGLQSKFLVSFTLFRPSLGRFFRAPALGPWTRVLESPAALVKTAGWFVVALLVFNYVAGGALPVWIPAGEDIVGSAPASPAAQFSGMLAALSVEQRLLKAQDALWTVWTAALGFCFFIAVLSRFAAVLAFRHEHRMSRAELEEEYRETEPPADMRAARREMSEEEKHDRK